MVELGGGADDDLLVEAPQVLEAAAAPRDNDDVRSHHGAGRRQSIEATNGGGDFGGGGVALDLHRPDQHPRREAVAEPVEDVADHRAGRRGDDADDPREIGERPFPRLVEQPLGGELPAPLLEQRHQRADAGGLQSVDDELIFGLAGKRREPAGGDNLDAFLRLETEARQCRPPHHRLEPRPVVLEGEVAMAG